jgi:hypothetical protein
MRQLEAADEHLRDTTSPTGLLDANVPCCASESLASIPNGVGPSLGEYAALVAAGVMSFAEHWRGSARGREMARSRSWIKAAGQLFRHIAGGRAHIRSVDAMWSS